MKCAYCLCCRCTKVRCPRGRYHCLPCYHGTVLDCPFFDHKQVTRYYRIKKRYPAVSMKDLVVLYDALSSIMHDVPDEEPSSKSLKQLLKEEELRHNKALKDIVRNSK